MSNLQTCLCCGKEFEAKDKNRVTEYGSNVIQRTFSKFGRVGGFMAGATFAYVNRSKTSGPIILMTGMLVCGAVGAIAGEYAGGAFGKQGDRYRDQSGARVVWICDVCEHSNDHDVD